MLVHARGTMPFPEDYGVMLTPGVFNVLGLRLVQLNRTPAPYGDCISDDMDTFYRNVYKEQFNVSYSKMVR